MAMIKMTDLKDVFNGISSFMFDTTPISLASGTITMVPEYELPVTVDTLSISQDDPTINHYKVHGLGTDWVSSSEPGDATIESPPHGLFPIRNRPLGRSSNQQS